MRDVLLSALPNPAPYARYYRQTAREIKRLGSIARSPIYDHFGEALSGAATIRAIRQVPRFELDSCLKMDDSQVQKRLLRERLRQNQTIAAETVPKILSQKRRP